MKKQILLAILATWAFMIIVSCVACTSSYAQGKQNISIAYTQDTSKISKSEKNQTIILKNQKHMMQNQGTMLQNQKTSLKNQGTMLKNQDSIKDNITDSTQQVISNNKNAPALNLQQTIYNNNTLIFDQLEKTQKTLKMQQREIDSMIVIHKKTKHLQK